MKPLFFDGLATATPSELQAIQRSMPDRLIHLRVDTQEFFLIKEAVAELLNDSDLIWGGPDDSPARYAQAKRLADRLEQIEQMVVIPH
jgi:hypothetical protein